MFPQGNEATWRSQAGCKLWLGLLVVFSQGTVSGHLTALRNLTASWKILLKEGKGIYEKKRAKPQVDN